jgi:hypothetical protein
MRELPSNIMIPPFMYEYEKNKYNKCPCPNVYKHMKTLWDKFLCEETKINQTNIDVTKPETIIYDNTGYPTVDLTIVEQIYNETIDMYNDIMKIVVDTINYIDDDKKFDLSKMIIARYKIFQYIVYPIQEIIDLINIIKKNLVFLVEKINDLIKISEIFKLFRSIEEIENEIRKDFLDKGYGNYDEYLYSDHKDTQEEKEMYIKIAQEGGGEVLHDTYKKVLNIKANLELIKGALDNHQILKNHSKFDNLEMMVEQINKLKTKIEQFNGNNMTINLQYFDIDLLKTEIPQNIVKELVKKIKGTYDNEIVLNKNDPDTIDVINQYIQGLSDITTQYKEWESVLVANIQQLMSTKKKIDAIKMFKNIKYTLDDFLFEQTDISDLTNELNALNDDNTTLYNEIKCFEMLNNDPDIANILSLLRVNFNKMFEIVSQDWSEPMLSLDIHNMLATYKPAYETIIYNIESKISKISNRAIFSIENIINLYYIIRPSFNTLITEIISRLNSLSMNSLIDKLRAVYEVVNKYFNPVSLYVKRFIPDSSNSNYRDFNNMYTKYFKPLIEFFNNPSRDNNIERMNLLFHTINSDFNSDSSAIKSTIARLNLNAKYNIKIYHGPKGNEPSVYSQLTHELKNCEDQLSLSKQIQPLFKKYKDILNSIHDYTVNYGKFLDKTDIYYALNKPVLKTVDIFEFFLIMEGEIEQEKIKFIENEESIKDIKKLLESTNDKKPLESILVNLKTELRNLNSKYNENFINIKNICQKFNIDEIPQKIPEELTESVITTRWYLPENILLSGGGGTMITDISEISSNIINNNTNFNNIYLSLNEFATQINNFKKTANEYINLYINTLKDDQLIIYHIFYTMTVMNDIVNKIYEPPLSLSYDEFKEKQDKLNKINNPYLTITISRLKIFCIELDKIFSIEDYKSQFLTAISNKTSYIDLLVFNHISDIL